MVEPIPLHLTHQLVESATYTGFAPPSSACSSDTDLWVAGRGRVSPRLQRGTAHPRTAPRDRLDVAVVRLAAPTVASAAATGTGAGAAAAGAAGWPTSRCR
jgi:hypothetical protein